MISSNMIVKLYDPKIFAIIGPTVFYSMEHKITVADPDLGVWVGSGSGF